MLKVNKTYRAEIVKTNLVIEYLYSNNMYELLKDLLFVVENNDVVNLKITEQYRNKILFSSYNPSEDKQIVEIMDAQEKCVQTKSQLEKQGKKWVQVGEEEVSILTESYIEALDILQQLKPSDSGRIIEYDNTGSYSEIAYKKCGSSSIYRWK